MKIKITARPRKIISGILSGTKRSKKKRKHNSSPYGSLDRRGFCNQNFNFLNLPGEIPSFSVKKYMKFDSLLKPIS